MKRLGGLKIGDLGISKDISKIKESTINIPGTTNYMSPEIIKGQKDYTNKIDVWAFGCVVYELFKLEKLFDDPNDYELRKKIIEAQIVLPRDTDDDPNLKQILKG